MLTSPLESSLVARNLVLHIPSRNFDTETLVLDIVPVYVQLHAVFALLRSEKYQVAWDPTFLAV